MQVFANLLMKLFGMLPLVLSKAPNNIDYLLLDRANINENDIARINITYRRTDFEHI